MTVQELIDKLREYPPNMQVVNVEVSTSRPLERNIYELEIFPTVVTETDDVSAHLDLSLNEEVLVLA